MRISHVNDSSLPALAWCLRLRRDSHDLSLVTGSAVHVDSERGAFFEGAWAGEFTEMAFDAAHAVFGSGAKLIHNGAALLIVPPSHTCERIHILRRKDATLASNSLAFVLEAAGDDLDPTYAGYIRDFERIVYGLDFANVSIPTRSGAQIHLVYHHNVRLTAAGEMRLIEKSAPPLFDDYASYRRMLEQTFSALMDNAQHPARALHSRYSPLSSVSTGYDSPAGAVLGAQVGCKRAVTFAQARPEGKGASIEDSGAGIGRALDMEVTEFSRDAYLSSPSPAEAEFLATGMSGEDVIMAAFEPALRNSVFFTGFHGDKIWDRLAHIPVNDKLKRGDLSGASLGEFRLRANFVHVPVPFIAGRQLAAIDRISNSDEMRPWSIGGDYDRPIPRRIVEEAGIARGAFGQAKKAATALLHLDGSKVLSPAARKAIDDFDASDPLPAETLGRMARQEQSELRGFFAMRVVRKLKLLHFVPGLRDRRFGIHNHTARGMQMLRWSLSEIGKRYAQASRQLK